MNWIAPILMFVFAGGLFACAVPATAQNVIETDDAVVPTITVSGQAELEKPADQLNLTLSVVTEAEEAQSAMQENSRKMQRVIEAIKRVGITDEEYETRRFSISPQYDRRRPEQRRGDRPEIVGYRVENAIQIETTKLELVGKLIEEATGAGANNVGNLSFGLADEREHRGEAIAEAVKNARSDAEALASAAGVQLKRIIAINLDNAATPPVPMRGEMMAMARGDSGPPIQAGDVTVRASVTIVYEIAN